MGICMPTTLFGENDNNKEIFMNDIKMIRIGITGGTGLLGNRLVELLSKKNTPITCLTRGSSNIEAIKDKVKVIKGDLSNLESLEDFVKGQDVIVHLAAQVSRTTKKEYYQSNVLGTENLCKAINRYNPECRLINCSSIAAYRIKGWCKLQFTDYAKSKLAADRVVDSYMKTIKATTIIPGIIYGAGNNAFISAIIENLEKGKLFFAKGGEKFAPLSYIDDLCDLFIRAIYNEESVGNKYFGIKYSERGIHDFIRIIASKTYNKAPDAVLSKNKLMAKAVFLQFVYSFFKIKKAPTLSIRMVDIMSINYSLSEEQRTNNLGWEPSVDMEEGVDNALLSYNLKKDSTNRS